VILRPGVEEAVVVKVAAGAGVHDVGLVKPGVKAHRLPSLIIGLLQERSIITWGGNVITDNIKCRAT